MGVRWLLRWQHPGAMPARNTFENICAAVEVFSQNRRRWAASCASFRPGKVDTALGPRDAGGPAVDMQVVSFSDAPASAFLLVRQERKVMAADKAILEIISRVTPFKARMTLAFEGWAFRLGDFVVRVGRAQLRPREEFKGVMAEVEYAPLVNLDVAGAALAEFVELLQSWTSGLVGSLQVVQVRLKEWQLPSSYSQQHLAVQYCSLAAALLSS